MKELPKTEKDLRIDAVGALDKMIQELAKRVPGISENDQVTIFRFYDVKAFALVTAREAIRQYCPHLKDGAEQALEGIEGDKPL